MDFSGEMQNFAIQRRRRHGAKLKRSSSSLAEMQRFELNCDAALLFRMKDCFVANRRLCFSGCQLLASPYFKSALEA